MPAIDLLVRIRATENMSAALHKINSAISSTASRASMMGSQFVTSSNAATSSLAQVQASLQANTTAALKTSAEASQIGTSFSSSSRTANSALASVQGSLTTTTTSTKALDATATATGGSFKTMGSAGTSALSSVKSAASSAIASMEGLSDAIGSVIAGFGLMEMASVGIGGAMERETRSAVLARRWGEESANYMLEGMRSAVEKSPAPTEILQRVLGPMMMQSKLTRKQIEDVAGAASDYYLVSMEYGQLPIEAQRELMDWIVKGETTTIRRDSPFAPYVEELEKYKDKSPYERAMALYPILEKMGYRGISQIDTTANRWDQVQDKIREVTKDIGEALLPVLSTILKVFDDIHKATGGWSTRILVGFGGIVAFLGSLSLIGSVVKTAFDPFISIGKKIGDKIKLTDKLKDAFGKVKDAAGKIPGKIRDALPPLDEVKGKLSSIKDTLSGIGSKAKDAFSRISLPDIRGRVTLPDTSGLSARLSGAISRVRGVPGGVVSSFNRLKGSITGATSAQWGLNRATLAGIGFSIKNAAATAAGAVKNFLYGAASKIAAVGQWLLNAAMSANPLVIIIIAIVALIAILLYLWKTNEGFRAAVLRLWEALKQVGVFIWGVLVAAWDALRNAASRVWGIFSNIASFIWDTLVAAWNALRDAIQWVTDKIKPLLDFLGWLKDAWDDVTKSIWDAIDALLNWNATPAESKTPGSGGDAGGGGGGSAGGGGRDVYTNLEITARQRITPEMRERARQYLAEIRSPLVIRRADGPALIKFPDLDPRNLAKISSSLESAENLAMLATAAKTVKIEARAGPTRGPKLIVFEKGAVQVDARDKTEEEAARIVAKGLRYWTAKEALL